MKKVEEFLESVSFDKRLYKYDIQGSIAHTKMLAKCKIIADSEGKKIVKALKEIEKEIKGGKLKFDLSLEDIHTHIEKRLIEESATNSLTPRGNPTSWLERWTVSYETSRPQVGP